MKIYFREIGRDKKSWVKEFGNNVTEDEIAAEAKRGGGLMSSCVEAEIYEQGDLGEIIVGSWRTVGSFTISKE